MSKTLAPAFILSAVVAGSVTYILRTDLEPRWEEVTVNAGWAPRDSSSEFVFDDRMWIVGGWRDTAPHMLYDVWASNDGRHWEGQGEVPMRFPDLAMSIVFDGAMWHLGGGGEPDAEVAATNEIWASNDGSNWRNMGSVDWSPRNASAVVEFGGKLWVLGGLEAVGRSRTLLNDVWSSSDGKTWTLVAKHADWSPRAFHQALVHDGKIWVLGGGSYTPDYQKHNDVWYSEDGVTWTRAPDAPWLPRIWFSAVEYKGLMWVIGGWSKQDENYGDVWYSSDGVEWNQVEPPETFRGRHEHSTFVFQDKIWMAGGHYGRIMNEVWSLQVSQLWLWRAWMRRLF